MKPQLSFALALLTLSACSTSPEPGLYTLGPAPGLVSTSERFVVQVARPALPGYLDQPSVMTRTGTYQVSANETVNWAAPLDAMFEQTLADDIQQRLPGAIVETGAGTVGAPVRFVLDTNIQQFNALSNGEVVLEAQMTLTDKASHDEPPVTPVKLSVAGGGSISSTAAALSELVGRYADQIILAIHAQEQGALTAKPQPPEQPLAGTAL